MMGSFAVIEIYDIVSIFADMSMEEFLLIKGSEAIIFGGVDIIFGIALFRIGSELGIISRIAGIFEILVGAFFITFFLAFVGLIFLIPATLLEIVLLYKCNEKLRSMTWH